MRLFVAIWPPTEVLDVLERLPRPDHPNVRWTPRDRWHVTLRFLGEVDDAEAPALGQAVEAVAARHPARQVTLGPATTRLSRSVLVVPVTGLDDLGAAVAAATSGIGAPPEDRPFSGHLTLARARGRGAVPVALAGDAVGAAWLVGEVAIVRSRLGAGGARYETVARAALPTRLPRPAGPDGGDP